MQAASFGPSIDTQRPKIAPTIAPMAQVDNSAVGLLSGQFNRNAPQSSMADLTLQYKREIGRRVLETLDEESLWQLAHRCLHKGLVRPAVLGNGALGIKLGKDNDPAVRGSAGQAVAKNTVKDEQDVKRHVKQNQEGKRPLAVGPVGLEASLKNGNTNWSGDQALKQRYGDFESFPNGYSGHPCPTFVQSKAQKENEMQNLPKSTVGTNPDEDQPNATTLILRNLPPGFDQASAQKWIDDQGCAGQYDFFLWFPAKQTSRLNSCGYAFVNFVKSEDALRFRKEHHLVKIPDPNPDVTNGPHQLPLSVAVAKVQGFTQNYLRFQHLREGSVPTRCAPFFSQDSIDNLSMEELEAASKACASHHQAGQLDDGQLTTVIVRNLPPSVETQEIARSWLDRVGYKGQYDFLLFLPAKRQRRSVKVTPTVQGLGYAFVNFKSPQYAANCLESLNGKCVISGDPALNCVGARVQGLKACLDHFTSLAQSGRCKPWVAGENDESRPVDAVAVPRRDPFSGPDGQRSYQ